MFITRLLQDDEAQQVLELFFGDMSHALEIIQVCLDSGGYIAGGFARQMFRCRDHTLEGRAASWKHYLQHGGDVDFFFKDRVDYERAIDGLMSAGFNASMHTVMSDTYVVSSQAGNVIIQLIHGLFGPINEILSTFDITNARIAFESNALHHDERFADLEESGSLHVSVCDGTKTLARVLSWKSRHGYSLHNDTKCLINEVIQVGLFDLALKSQDVPLCDGHNQYTLSNLYYDLKRIKQDLDDRSLIEIWMALGPKMGLLEGSKDYASWAERSLNRRAGRLNRA